MDIFLLYVFTRVNVLLTIFGVAAFVLLFIVALLHMTADINGIGRDNRDEITKKHRQSANRLLWVAVPCVVMVAIIPSQRDLAIILAGHGLFEIAKSETAGRLASKSVQLIEQTLDGYLKKDAK